MKCNTFLFSALTLLLDNRMGIRLVKSWMLVCWWWWFDRSFIRLTVTTTSLPPIKSRMVVLEPADMVCPGKWPLYECFVIICLCWVPDVMHREHLDIVWVDFYPPDAHPDNKQRHYSSDSKNNYIYIQQGVSRWPPQNAPTALLSLWVPKGLVPQSRPRLQTAT